MLLTVTDRYAERLIVWLVGAAMALPRWPFGYFFVSTFLFGMMIVEFSHFINPFLEDGTFHYSAGMYTALLPIIAAWNVFRIVLREMKTARMERVGCYNEHATKGHDY